MQKRPDLAIMLFDLAVSGVSRNALRIARATHAAGLKTEIWVARSAGQLLDEVPDGVTIHGLNVDIADDYTRRQRKQALANCRPALAALLSERRPRIAFSAGNHFHGTATAPFQAAGDRAATRLIGRVSNELPRLRWSRLPGTLRKLRNARRRLGSMDRLVAVSLAIKDQLAGRLSIDPAKIEVVPNGIDLSGVRALGSEPFPHPWFEDGGPPVVLGVGRLVPQKGFDTLIEAVALARHRLPMRLVIVGEGPSPTREALVRLAERSGISGQVSFAGFVANPLPFYKAAGLFVSSSRWEGMSNVILEALASGCPVVATSVPGSEELLDRGTYGPLVPVRDAKQLASAIVETLLNPLPRDKLLNRAAAYDLDVTMQRYVRLFQTEIAATSDGIASRR